MSADAQEAQEEKESAAPAPAGAPGAPPPEARPGPLALLGRREGAALLLCIGALLCLPRLGAVGLWDPQEISKLDVARDMLGSPWMVLPERHARPPLPLLLLALGLKAFGTSELGARLPVALCGLLLLGALHFLGTLLTTRRAAFLSGLCLLTAPTFFLGARQATVHLLPALGHVLAVSGLLCVVRPRPVGEGLRGERALGLLLAALGLLIGFFSLGAPLGVGAPALALGLALGLSGDGARAPAAALLGGLGALALLPPARLCVAQSQLAVAPRIALGAGLVLAGALALGLGRRLSRSGAGLLGAGLGVLGAGLLFPVPGLHHGYSVWLGGFFRWPPSRDVQIDTVLRPLGFQLFPWAGLLPVALSALLGAAAYAPDGSRRRLQLLLPLTWFVVTYFLATYQAALSQEVPLPAIGALLLAAGAYLDGLLEQEGRQGRRAAGVVAALLVFVLGRDLYLYPEQFGNAHFAEGLKWPAPLTWVSPALVNFSLAFGGALGLALALTGRLRRALLLVALGLALALAALSAYGLVPALSRHVSHRGLFTRYKQLGGERLGVYAVPRSGSKFYNKDSVDLVSVAQVFDFLHKDQRKNAFVLIGATELAAVDQHAKQRGLSYYVIDDSNVQFLLISSQLPPGEVDRNPLRRLVLATEPQPRRAVRATFEDKIELLGYDLPDELQRGQDVLVRLYFKVLKPVGGDYRVFLHIEGGGSRINGDHSPLDGKFPTIYWVPGYYVIDEHRMNVSRTGQSPGTYQVLMGFWPGGSGARLKVTSGPQDGDNRVKLGAVRVK